MRNEQEEVWTVSSPYQTPMAIFCLFINVTIKYLYFINMLSF